MKIQIRRNVFETNSSNEHSLTIMNNDMYRKWKNGEVLARVKSNKESDVSWGNFWSRMLSLEFTSDFTKANEENKNLFEELVNRRIQKLEDYKERCLTHKKLVEKVLTEQEEELLSEEERMKYEDDLYEDSLYEFNEKEYNEELEEYKSYTYADVSEYFGLVDSGFWVSYEEFWKDWIEDNDCYSPFEHEDSDNNVYIIGKYFHS